MKAVVRWCGFILVFLMLVEVSHSSSSVKKPYHNNHKKYEVPRVNKHVKPASQSTVKKTEIDVPQKNGEQQKDKRGFLSSLANLLHEADELSGLKNSVESGLSSITVRSNKSLDEVKEADRSTAKKEEMPNLENGSGTLKDTPKDFAPVFAMFHGKVVQLGKLPDSAFKKSHAETIPAPSKQDKHSDIITLTNIPTISSENEKRKSSKVEKLSKLKLYLNNLDARVPETSESKGGTAKDQVVFPEQVTGSVRSDILNHVKGVVLDNGKILSLSGSHQENIEDAVKTDQDVADAQQKFIVSDDGSLTPLTKNNPEVGESVTRDTTENNDSQKTVALSLDVLKNLMKKSDSKISLANLLNKNVESKSEEDEDPGTIEDFAAGGLKSHNKYRAKHHDEPLIWSDDLAAKAQKLAESLADKKTLEISKDLEKSGFGENVAKVWATFKNAGEAASDMWYKQNGNYHFFDPHLDESTGQFTQVIWKGTKELGMGVAKSIDDVNNKYVYVTALYHPPGNVDATLRDNILPTGNNTVDVYTTFFKRTGVHEKRSKVERKSSKRSHFHRHHQT